MDTKKTLETLKSILYDENEIYKMDAPDHHYMEMFNESIKEAIFYLSVLNDNTTQEKQIYNIGVVDNHGYHCIDVESVEICHLREAEDVEHLLFDLPECEQIRLKHEIMRSKNPTDKELLKYFDLKFDLTSI